MPELLNSKQEAPLLASVQLQETVEQSADNLSMMLITAAIQNSKSYRPILSALLSLIGCDINTVRKGSAVATESTVRAIKAYPNIPFAIGMISRVLFAASLRNDKNTAVTTCGCLEALLPTRSKAKDHWTTQAWGYLTFFYAIPTDGYNLAIYSERSSECYAAIKNYMQSIFVSGTLPTLAQKSHATWAAITVLSATAKANDVVEYQYFIKQISTLMGTDTVAEALNKIPHAQHRAWAIGMVRYAAKLAKDTKLVNSLEKPLNEAILAAPTTNSKLVANTCKTLSDTVTKQAPAPQATATV